MLASELSAMFLHRKIGSGGKNYRPDAAIPRQLPSIIGIASSLRSSQ
jgi:hypothetical protein